MITDKHCCSELCNPNKILQENLEILLGVTHRQMIQPYMASLDFYHTGGFHSLLHLTSPLSALAKSHVGQRMFFSK